jgi:predicted dehydrogenase
MEKQLRVGIVGVGAIAVDAHIPCYAKHEQVQIAAFVDPDVERVKRYAKKFSHQTGRPEPSVFSTLQELIQANIVDAVSICTPNASHTELACLALEAGLHVLVEKPMATNVRDADRLANLARDSDKVVMVGMSHRYRDDVSVLKRFVETGELGNIYYAKTRILRRRGTPRGWFSDIQRSGGGPLMDIGVHALDLTWWLLGMPRATSVSGFLHRGVRHEDVDFVATWTSLSQENQHNEVYTTEDFASAFIRFENGTVLQMEVSWELHGSEDDALKVELYGEKGGLSLDPLRYFTTKHGVLTTTELKARVGSLHQNEIDHFVQCVTSGARPISDAAQGRDVVEMLQAISESSNQKREIRFS